MKRLNEFKYTLPEAKLIVGTERQKLPEAYREASAAVALFQAENAELEDSYLCELLMGNDPMGIMPKGHPEKPASLPAPRGLTDGELEQSWRSLDPAIKTLGEMYLAPGVIRSHDKIIVESVAFLIAELTAIRQEPSLTPSGLQASFERARMLLKKGVNSLKGYLNSGHYCIDPDSAHWSEGGDSFFHLRYLPQEDKEELLHIRDARARARYEGVSQHTRIPLPPEDGSLVDTGERRCEFRDCAVRALGDGTRREGKRRISVFIPYGSPSAPLHSAKHGSFVEILMPGAFARALGKGNDIACLWNHDSSKPLAHTRNKSLIIEEKPDGLYYELYPNFRVSWAVDAWETIKAQTVVNSSFAFEVKDERWPSGEKIEGHPVRQVWDVERITEVSLVSFPAYQSSQAVASGGE